MGHPTLEEFMEATRCCGGVFGVRYSSSAFSSEPRLLSRDYLYLLQAASLAVEGSWPPAPASRTPAPSLHLLREELALYFAESTFRPLTGFTETLCHGFPFRARPFVQPKKSRASARPWLVHALNSASTSVVKGEQKP
jgi:hypothetical protein